MADEKKLVFGRRLKSIRERRGITQTELGYRTGINQNRISNWELGYAYPSVEMLVLLAGGLSCSADELVGLSEPKLTEDELWCLTHYRNLGIERRRAIREMIATLEGFVPADEQNVAQ